jgi:hypothetical protein
MILYEGNAEFDDMAVPAKGKNEWGVDTLIRRMRGARSLLPAFIASLAQGQSYQDYFLQTWEIDDDPVFATVTLGYKGLLNGTPVPKNETRIMQASGSASISFVTENAGLGRIYKQQTLYAEPLFDDPIGQTVGITQKRNIYTVGAQIEFIYDAVESVYSYVRTGRPAAPRYNVVNSLFVPQVIEARGITADGSNFGKNDGLFTAFNLQIIQRAIGFNVAEITGTPFFECQDVVRKELRQPSP